MIFRAGIHRHLLLWSREGFSKREPDRIKKSGKRDAPFGRADRAKKHCGTFATAVNTKTERKILLGTMLSQHNIGKNLVGTLLSIGGFEVVDMGEKNTPWDFYEMAESSGADMIAVSVVFAPAMEKFTELLDLLKEMKVREKYPVIVGGAVTSQKWADKEGADGWGAQARDGVDLARNLLGVA